MRRVVIFAVVLGVSALGFSQPGLDNVSDKKVPTIEEMRESYREVTQKISELQAHALRLEGAILLLQGMNSSENKTTETLTSSSPQEVGRDLKTSDVVKINDSTYD